MSDDQFRILCEDCCQNIRGIKLTSDQKHTVLVNALAKIAQSIVIAGIGHVNLGNLASHMLKLRRKRKVRK